MRLSSNAEIAQPSSDTTSSVDELSSGYVNWLARVQGQEQTDLMSRARPPALRR
jgi:hypothetical protein